MIKVITYGTFDLLHFGHVRLLQRAKALGDYLIVGVTSDTYDRERGKINVQQPLLERVEAVKALGIADEIIIEEYEGQKIDDIREMGIDIFTVGSDWTGKFDYLNAYCRVVYLKRTEEISSTKIREERQPISMGLVGDSIYLNKIAHEGRFVNGLRITAICTDHPDNMSEEVHSKIQFTNRYEELVGKVDAIYLHSRPQQHYRQAKYALEQGKHVLCESPMTLHPAETQELIALAKSRGLIFQEAIKTAYSTAYVRMLLLLKSGKIGQVVSVDATCTSLEKRPGSDGWDSFHTWGPTAVLPILQILGTDYHKEEIVSGFREDLQGGSLFNRTFFVYPNAVATCSVGSGVKSEGELIVSGTKGYVYVPAPWWKTDYFEVRYENPANNQRYFYSLEGEGIRYELVAFVHAIHQQRESNFVERKVSIAISKVMEDFKMGSNLIII